MKQYILFVAQLYHFYADIYSLEYSGILYVFMCPILVSMASLLTSCNNAIMQNIPFNGARRRLAPPPFLANNSFSHSNIFILSYQSALYRICMYHVTEGYVTIHEKGNESKSTCLRCVGGPGRLPAPSPGSVGGAAGGGGGKGWQAGSCLGILSREGGISGKQAAS